MWISAAVRFGLDRLSSSLLLTATDYCEVDFYFSVIFDDCFFVPIRHTQKTTILLSRLCYLSNRAPRPHAASKSAPESRRERVKQRDRNDECGKALLQSLTQRPPVGWSKLHGGRVVEAVVTGSSRLHLRMWIGRPRHARRRYGDHAGGLWSSGRLRRGAPGEGGNPAVKSSHVVQWWDRACEWSISDESWQPAKVCQPCGTDAEDEKMTLSLAGYTHVVVGSSFDVNVFGALSSLTHFQPM
ncbi:hypothetical protein TcWFU_008846 [Taenia crassiceps]|uniref:Uncharacterized protein n=1 Tax=Taenia crassiceps TaxID=6207 RepID=A0ABR4Q566_9CEST